MVDAGTMTAWDEAWDKMRQDETPIFDKVFRILEILDRGLFRFGKIRIFENVE